MVFAFFKKADPGLEHIATRSVAMLNDARHSFDLATLALLGGATIEAVAEDVRATDHRINQAEQDLRSELVVHVSVQGTADIGLVMGYTLLLKKIERIGDQAKNILDLAEEGATLADGPDSAELMAERQTVSELFAEAAELLAEPDEHRVDGYAERIQGISAAQQEKINSLTHTDMPGREAVPRAIYYRYMKRIVANLLGVVSTASEPLPHIDYLDDGNTDITDD
ncbi:MAG: PhoU domain-containing protein [Acidimicrobiales bacterium]